MFWGIIVSVTISYYFQYHQASIFKPFNITNILSLLLVHLFHLLFLTGLSSSGCIFAWFLKILLRILHSSQITFIFYSKLFPHLYIFLTILKFGFYPCTLLPIQYSQASPYWTSLLHLPWWLNSATLTPNSSPFSCFHETIPP